MTKFVKFFDKDRNKGERACVGIYLHHYFVKSQIFRVVHSTCGGCTSPQVTRVETMKVTVMKTDRIYL